MLEDTRQAHLGQITTHHVAGGSLCQAPGGTTLPDNGPDPSSAGTTLGDAPRFEETAPDLPLPRRGYSRAQGPSTDAATAVHLVSLVGAFAFWTWLDRGLWFFGDEWDFLITRGLRYGPTNPKSIWFPHNEHWSTLPVLLWRGLFNVFHLGSYWPYIVPVLLAQLGVMHLTWRLCRRAGVTPWVATAAVAMLGFLGAGAEDLTWGFQIGFVGSVLFGLLAFDLLDRPLANQAAHRAGTLASVALLASLMCSTIGDAMLLGAALLAFARRPKREAVRVLALPVVAYALWFVVVGRLGLTEHSDQFPLARFTGAPGFVWTGILVGSGPGFQPRRRGRRDPGWARSVGRLEKWSSLAPKSGTYRAMCGGSRLLWANCSRQGWQYGQPGAIPLCVRGNGPSPTGHRQAPEP